MLVNGVEKILITQEEIAARVKAMGEEISSVYQGKEIFMVCVLKGATIFMADLARTISVPVAFDFMAVSSYGASTQSSGVVRILKDLEESVEDKHVLIVEDIIDTGLTINYLLENLKSRNPASVKICTFLNKPERRKVNVQADFNGFDIPDAFVVGYGLDYAGRYRNLPYVGILKP